VSEKNEFTFPEVQRGCAVEVSSEPSRSDETLGIVINAKNSTVDVLAFHSNGAVSMRRNCWHVDDPRCVSLAQVFQDGDRGVFRLAASELRQREIMTRLDGLERVLESLVGDVEALKQPADKQDGAPTKSRRRGKQLETAGV
jgi:hypothetical protein